MRGWFLAGVVLLGGCASARIETSPERFALRRSATIAPADVEQFVACVTTGFDGAHWLLTNSTVRQTRHGRATRIETLAGGRTSVIVVTVEDAGGVTLHEANAAAMINTRGEVDAFDACLAGIAREARGSD